MPTIQTIPLVLASLASGKGQYVNPAVRSISPFGTVTVRDVAVCIDGLIDAFPPPGPPALPMDPPNPAVTITLCDEPLPGFVKTYVSQRPAGPLYAWPGGVIPHPLKFVVKRFMSRLEYGTRYIYVKVEYKEKTR